MVKPPSYDGAGLVNLIAEIESTLTGDSPSPRLGEGLAIPSSETIVLVLFDGLGMAQLAHPEASPLAISLAGTLDAPFATTTNVSLATVATGLPPSRHGQVTHLTWLEEVGEVVNTLKWVTIPGHHVPFDYPSVLPSPNLWERLRRAGVEPITVQPGDFSASPLSRVLYRGARFEPAWDVDDLVNATIDLAAVARRLIFTYVPHVDFAGHVFGVESEEFASAMKVAAGVWEGLASSLPPEVVLIGTADHGLASFTEEEKLLIRDPRFDPLRFAGDTRGVHLWGDPGLMSDLAEMTGGVLADPIPLIGPNPTDQARARVGDRVLIPPDDMAIIPRGFDKRLRAYHGGLSPDELKIPLLVA